MYHVNSLTLITGHVHNCFVKRHLDCAHKYPEVNIKKVFEFLMDNIYEVFGNRVKQFDIIFMGTSCALLLSEQCLYSYEAEYIQKLVRETILITRTSTLKLTLKRCPSF